MFAVDAFLSLNGDLSIEITALGETQANLLSDGLDFFVDANNNQTYDLLELRGSIDQLKSISVDSPDSVGTFLWQGDFFAAALDSPDSVDIQSIDTVLVHANFTSLGNVSIDVSNQAVFGSEANIGGGLSIEVGPTGTISDTNGAKILVQGDAAFVSQSDILLSDNAANRWVILGHSHFQTTGSIDIGSAGTFDTSELSVQAANAIIAEHDSVHLRDLTILGDFELSSNTIIEDFAGATIRIDGDLSLRSGTISLADGASDVLTVNGNAEFLASSGNITIAQAGTVTLGSLFASGTTITVFEDDAMQIQSIAAAGNAQLASGGAVTDASNARITTQGNLVVTGTSITLADNVTDVLHVVGDSQFVATSGDVNLGPAGDVQLGTFSSSGLNITLEEDDSTQLMTIDATGDLRVTSVSTVTDNPRASIAVAGDATLVGTSITLADNATETLSIGGLATFTANAGDVLIADAGTVTLGLLAASGTNITVFEDDAMQIQSIAATGNAQLTSTDAVTDATNARIVIQGNLLATGTSITLADNATDVLHVVGDSLFVATLGDVNLGPAGDVQLGTFSADGVNVTLEEDDSTQLLTIDATGDLRVTSVSNVTDNARASIRSAGDATLVGTSITLADNATEILSVGGLGTFIANAGDVLISDPGTVTLGVLAASGTNVTVFEDDAMQIQSIAATGNARLTSGGAVSDATNAPITTQGNLVVTGSSITLADNATDSLQVVGDSQFVAIAGDANLGPAGDVRLGAFSASGVNVTLQEDDSTQLLTIDSAGELRVTSVSTVTDNPRASIRVTGNASIVGTSITLADNTSETLSVAGLATFTANAGDVLIASDGTVTLGRLAASGMNVTVFEDDAMQIQSIAATGNAQLASGGAVTDASNARITTQGNLVVTGTSITLADNSTDVLHVVGDSLFVATLGDVNLGPAGDVQLGTFSADGVNVTLEEDDSTQLMTIDATGDLRVTSASIVTDNPRASIRAAGDATIVGTAITLADNATEILSVGGLGTFIANAGDVMVADAGVVTLGLLAASGTNVTVFEDDAMQIQSIAATGNAQLTSAGAVSDVTNARITAQGNLVASGTSITLASNATDVLHVVGDSQFVATAGNVNLGPAGDVQLGTFSADGVNVTLEEDDSTQLMTIDATGDLRVTSASTVTDNPRASIRAAGDATIVGTAITLADNATETLSVGGLATFTANAGVVLIADPGAVTLGPLAASGTNVTVFEDDAMQIQSIVATGNAQLTSGGAVSDATNARITTQGNLVVTGSSITLADNSTDVLRVVGDSQFVATSGNVNLGPAGDVRLGTFSASGVNVTMQEDDSTQLMAIDATGDLRVTSVSTVTDNPRASIRVTGNATIDGSSITLADNATETLSIGGLGTFIANAGDVLIADAGTVTLGVLAASGTNVTVFEDDAMQIQSIAATGNAQLTSGGAVSDATNARITTQGNLVVTGSSITLADSATDSLQVVGDSQFVAIAGDVNLGPAGDVRLGAFSASGVNVTLQEDDSTQLLTIDSTGDLRVTSVSNVTDNARASIRAAGDATIDGSSITLADNATETLSIGGLATFTANAGDVLIADAGTVTLGLLAASGTNVTVFEDDAMHIQSIAATGNAQLTSGGLVSDATNARISTQGTLVVTGSSITLADNATDVLQVVGDSQFVAISGDVNLGPAGDVQLGTFSANGVNVTLQEDDSTQLMMIDATGELRVTSVSTVTDNSRASIRAAGDATIVGTAITLADNASETLSVGGLATFTANAGDVLLGDAGTVTLGQLAASGTNVTVFEDDAMQIQLIAATGNAQLTSGGLVSDATNARITTQGNLVVTGSSITLADIATDVLHVVGDSQFVATSGDVNLGPAGDVRLGVFSANGVNITMQEEDSTQLMAIDATGDLRVTSVSTVTDNPRASIRVAGNATIEGSSITLADNKTEILSVGGLGTFIANAGDVMVADAGTVTLRQLTASGTNVTVFEDDAMQIQSIAATGNAQLTSGGLVSDATNARITTQGNLVVTGSSLTLADNVTDVLQVVGDSQFVATAGDVNLGPAGDVQLGTFSSSGLNITLEEDDSTQLMTIDSTGDLRVTSVSTVTDNPRASIAVAGDATLVGTSITLADNASETLSIGGLGTFTANAGDVLLADAGAVTLGLLAASGTNVTAFEDDAMHIQSIAATGNAQLTSGGLVSDATNARITTQGNLVATGTSITLADNLMDVLHVDGDSQFVATSGDVNFGPAGDVRLGTFSASANNIAIQEDDTTDLRFVDARDLLDTTSSENIRTVNDAGIVARQWDAHANGFIQIADAPRSSIDIETDAFFHSNGNVTIASPGRVRFGSVGFLAADVFLSEDSSTHLDGSAAQSLVVESVQRITQSGIDTGSGIFDLEIAGDVQLDLSDAPGEVYLMRRSTDPPTSVSDSSLSNNRFHGVVTVQGISGNVELRNISSTATVGTLSGALDDLRIWHSNSDVVLLGDIRVGGDLDIIAGIESSDTSLESANPVDRVSAAIASIQDRGNLSVEGNARFTAAGDIRLSDMANESIRVLGSTSLVSLNAGHLVLGTDGTADSSSIAAYSVDSAGNRGALVASLDSSTIWDSPQIAFPDGRLLPNLLSNLTLQINGTLDDTVNARTQLSGDLTIAAVGSILWGDSPSNTLQIAGNSFVQSTQGNIELGSHGVFVLGDTRLEARNGTIQIGGAGHTEIGIVELLAKSIAVSEDESLIVRTAIADGILDLASRKEIFNLLPFDQRSSEGVSATHGFFRAGSFVFLGQVSMDALQVVAHANGTLPDTPLFQLNEVADDVGQRFLEIFGSNLPPGIQTNQKLIDGPVFSKTLQEASFLQQFDRAYGVYLTNLRSMQIDSIQTDGDDVRVYIETLNGENLQVNGIVTLTTTTTKVGGVVLIAGGELDIREGGELRLQQASNPTQTEMRVKDEHFSIRAFDGGTGLPGYLSTRDVLYASDAFADSGTQNVLQRLAVQFGNRGEAGFENWVQYADGRIQNFDESGELFASQIDANAQANRIGTLQAFAPESSDIAVLQRAIPFEDSLLGSFQTLPTLAVFRRDFAFFLFEEGGNVDLASSTEQSPAFDPVLDVYSPGRKVSLPLPTDIVVSRPILVPSQPWVPNTDSAVALETTEIPSSPLSQASFEIAIYEIGFEDTNANGQPDDSELPLRNKVVFSTADNLSEKSTNQINESDDSMRPDVVRAKQGEVIEKTRDVKGVAAATTEQLDNWMDEYRKDPLKRSGAYAIISKDSITGVEVLRVFSIRDSESDNQHDTLSPQGTNGSESSRESAVENSLDAIQAPLPAPAVPTDRDDLSMVAPIDCGNSTELVMCNVLIAGSGVAMVSASRNRANASIEPSFRRRDRRRRTGGVE